MAKTSVKARQKKREKMVEKFAAKREELKKSGDLKALDDMPKNSSRVRLKNRCQLTGRPKGYVRYFGLSRVMLRDMALNGKIPGLKKRPGNPGDRNTMTGINQVPGINNIVN